MELSPAQIATEWKNGKFRPVYYLFGEESSAKLEAAQRLKAAINPNPFNLNEFAGPSPDPLEIVSAALTPPMFADRRLVIVKNPKLGSEARRLLAEYLGGPLDSTTLLLFSEDRKPDVRDVLSAVVASRQGLVVFKPMKEEEARRRLSEAARAAKMEIDEDAAELLVDEVGTDWGILTAELGKMILFARGKGRIRREDAIVCLGYKQASNPFDFPRILQTRDRAQALRELNRLLADGVEPLQLLYKVSWTLNRQLKAKRLRGAGKSENEIFSALRLQSYYDRDYMRWVAAVSETSLIAALNACLDLEARLKSETWLDGRIELERLVAAICRPAAKRQALAAGAGAEAD